MKFTILGASGFIGSHLVQKLESKQITYSAPKRNADLQGKNLGHVVYCIGLTSDFRSKPFETVEAHVSKLLDILKFCEFESLLYLSSTRLYKHKSHTTIASELDEIEVNPNRLDDLYNFSKLMGESLLLNSGKDVKIARLSNVYGNDYHSDNFLPSIIRDALVDGEINLRTSLDSCKDYIHIDKVSELLLKIAADGKQRMYNVASGINTQNRELIEHIQKCTGCQVSVESNAPTISFPTISIQRIQQEFAFSPTNILNDITKLIELYKSQGIV